MVFVPFHKAIRKELQRSKEDIVIIYPSNYLKDEWIKKLKDRYEKTDLSKYAKAWFDAKNRYDEDINELREYGINCGFMVFEITTMDYDLASDIEHIKSNISFKK